MLRQVSETDSVIYYTYTQNSPKSFYRGQKRYELSNHLGNVLAVITDRRIQACGASDVMYYNAQVVSVSDYYPFGMGIKEREWKDSSFGYRFGFNGMEQDDEVKGDGNSLDFGARIYDSRLGRWLSVDPLMKQFPSESNYCFTSNSPILLRDVAGKSGKVTIKEASEEGGRPQLVVTTNITLYGGATNAQATAMQSELNEVYNGYHTTPIPYSYPPENVKDGGTGEDLLTPSYKIVNVNGVDYDLVFDFNVDVNNGITKEEMSANTDVANNYVRMGSDAAKASLFRQKGNSGMVRAGDLKRKTKSAAHEIFHGYTGNNHPDPKIPIIGTPPLNTPEGSANVEKKYKHETYKYGGLVGQNREFTQENANQVVENIDWNEANDGGNIGTATNEYRDEKGRRVE